MSDTIESAEAFVDRIGDAIDTSQDSYNINYDVSLALPLVEARDAAMLERGRAEGKREAIAEIVQRSFEWKDQSSDAPIRMALEDLARKYASPAKGDG